MNHWQAYAESVDSENVKRMMELAESKETPLFYRIRLATDILNLIQFDNEHDAWNIHLWAHDLEVRSEKYSKQLALRMFYLADYAIDQMNEMEEVRYA